MNLGQTFLNGDNLHCALGLLGLTQTAARTATPHIVILLV